MLLLELADFDLGRLLHDPDVCPAFDWGTAEGSSLILQVAQQTCEGLNFIQHDLKVRELLGECAMHLHLGQVEQAVITCPPRVK